MQKVNYITNDGLTVWGTEINTALIVANSVVTEGLQKQKSSLEIILLPKHFQTCS